MTQFCKVFETDYGQLLIERTFEGDFHNVTIRGEDFEGLVLSIAVGFVDQLKADKMLEDFGQSDAQEQAEMMHKMARGGAAI